MLPVVEVIVLASTITYTHHLSHNYHQRPVDQVRNVGKEKRLVELVAVSHIVVLGPPHKPVYVEERED